MTDSSKLPATPKLPSTPPELQNGSKGNGQQIRLGIAAMDRKARSKPMRNILSRLLAMGQFDIRVFGDKVILDEKIEDWPECDFLITFYSTGFPIDKAIEYVRWRFVTFDIVLEQSAQVELRKPVCINDLPMQKVFWDRRIVLKILDHLGVPTPTRLEVNRDGGPNVEPALADQIFKFTGVRFASGKVADSEMKYDDDKEKLTVDGKTLAKSYVEKPVSGEDHNINIYFSKRRGGGGRRLFRKIGNKSSELDPNLTHPRTDASYIYEQFMDVENAEDVKVYTLGPNFVHAETRKSPVVDGVVRRNTDGKEIRFICQLTEEESKMASAIAKGFKQNICGFDLLRVKGKSYVIDVNGWSFVKGNDFYYDKCAEILAKFCNARLPSLPLAPAITGVANPLSDSKGWKLKSTAHVFRHADRTPKMKLKFAFKGKDEWTRPFIDLLQGRNDEIILRQTEQLRYILDAAEKARTWPEADKTKLSELTKILDLKIGVIGTKAQIKPAYNDAGEVEKVQVIIKWGGEFTHAARYQSRDIAENIKKDVNIMNKSLMENTTIYTSSERRVIATAEIFSTYAFLRLFPRQGRQIAYRALLDETKTESGEPMPHELIVRKDLLDDSNAAKEPMDKVKKRLKTLLRPGQAQRPEFCWPVPDLEPVQVVAETMDLMRYHRDLMYKNWSTLDVDNIQARWCCGEYPYLFRERWEKLFGDFCDIDQEKFDPARVSELYDNLKYDALHNRVFLETIFREHNTKHDRKRKDTGSSGSSAPPNGDDTDDNVPSKLKQLYLRAKELFDLIGPQEYGIERDEKEEIGLLTSWPLLNQIGEDLRAARESTQGHASYYFTKESHIQTLVNLIIFSDLRIVMPRVPELDYMAYIAFEVYERGADGGKEFSCRVSLSEGAHGMPLDTSLDAKHALRVQQRRVLTNHLPLPEVLASFGRYERESAILKKSTTPFEGMLPVEGDTLFLGKPDKPVHTLHFRPETAKSRPHSIASDRADKGDTSD